MPKKNLLRTLLLSIAIISLCAQNSSQPIEDRANAYENFRLGVQAYYRGTFNEAILAFEKALAALPREELILDWLGKAYYRSGLEQTALFQWETAANNTADGSLQAARIETVRFRREQPDVPAADKRYVESGVFPSKNAETVFYMQPSSIYPLSDGSCWAVAYGSNEIIRFDVNGSIIDRSRGSIAGFRRPMDICALPDGTLLVTEYAADRVSALDARGRYIASFGSRGRGEGEFVGPQYIAAANGYIYVTDFGGARVVAFDKNYSPVFTFGTKTQSFAGLSAPTGIAALNETIYVADAAYGNLIQFDRNGNYLGTLLEPNSLNKPEAIRVYNGALIVADGNRILQIDADSGTISTLADAGGAPARLTCAAFDANGNIIASDFKNGQILVFTGMTELIGGMFVQIERVIADKFPQVEIEVRVEDRGRNPISGLNFANFYITEEKRPAALAKLDYAAYLSEIADLTVVIERSPRAEAYSETITGAVAEIAAAMNGRGTLRVVSAGAVPLLEYSGSPAQISNPRQTLFKNKSSADWNFDLGIRLAANDLINAEKKRAVIYISTGELSSSAFERYGLSDLAAYLNNNGVIFSAVYLEQNASRSEFSYLCKQTNGTEYYVYRPEGLARVVSDVIDAPNGSYRLSYTSSLPTDFGRAYLPVEIEAYVMNRSGRDETGYFAPLE